MELLSIVAGKPSGHQLIFNSDFSRCKSSAELSNRFASVLNRCCSIRGRSRRNKKHVCWIGTDCCSYGFKDGSTMQVSVCTSGEGKGNLLKATRSNIMIIGSCKGLHLPSEIADVTSFYQVLRQGLKKQVQGVQANTAWFLLVAGQLSCAQEDGRGFWRPADQMHSWCCNIGDSLPRRYTNLVQCASRRGFCVSRICSVGYSVNRRHRWMPNVVEASQGLLDRFNEWRQKGEKGDDDQVDGGTDRAEGEKRQISDGGDDGSLPPEGFIIFMSCIVGLVTGSCVVLFNLGEHALHDLVWEGVSGPSWLRAHPIEETWRQVIFVPVAGGLVVGLLNSLRGTLEALPQENMDDAAGSSFFSSGVKAFLRPVLKAAAAVVTLGTGNSLGPEGPSVEIGASFASGVGTLLKSSRERKLSFIAAGSAAGIASGFNAAVAGCFFSVESVLRPISNDNSTSSLTTAMVILSSVLASVVSQAGLGSEPAFRIPAYDFRSPAELPLYLLLGILCGLVSVSLAKGSAYATSAFDYLKALGVPAGLLPSLGGFCVGLIALAYPEVLYWGFQNLDVLLQSRMPWVKAPSGGLLLQLVGVKVLATSLCRGSGLVGGIYAPSLFIGAALGSAYGSMVSYAVANAHPMYHLDILLVASPQAYALVGMAATLAGVCQVPFTSVLLLFELTRDYRIILPLMAAVGLSTWIASAATNKKKQSVEYKSSLPSSAGVAYSAEKSSSNSEPVLYSRTTSSIQRLPSTNEVNGAAGTGIDREGKELCAVDASLCLTTDEVDEEKLKEQIPAAMAMKTKFYVVSPDATIGGALVLMIAHKERCVLIMDKDGLLEGILTLGDVQQEAERLTGTGLRIEVDRRPVSKVCTRWSSGQLVTVYADMSLRAAERKMARRGLRQVPVVTKGSIEGSDRNVIGLLDSESISQACRAEATRRMLGLPLSLISATPDVESASWSSAHSADTPEL